jgi:hypothetical protein
VKALLMGGQACVFYGAAEFSKDADIVLLAESDNIERLRRALDELEAKQVYVPALDESVLSRGHGVHFRCSAAEAKGIRLDVMAKLRGVDAFEALWERRTVFADRDGNEYELLGLEDLVRAKKTQRGKDWPMIARLVEANYIENEYQPNEQQIRFWLREMRAPKYLIAIAQRFRDEARELTHVRPLLCRALEMDEKRLEEALGLEEDMERRIDAEYWGPLKQELAQLRRQSREK